MQQLLWIETLLKLAGGLALSLAPMTVIKILGWPVPATGFWPRLLGAVLLGLSAATFIEGRLPGSRGLGLAGCLVINLASAAMITALGVTGAAAGTRRGTLALWLLVAALLLLALFEIAHA